MSWAGSTGPTSSSSSPVAGASWSGSSWIREPADGAWDAGWWRKSRRGRQGGALGVGVLGATLAFELARRLASAKAGGIDIVAALRPETHNLLRPEQLRLVQDSLGRTLRDVFLQMLALSLVAILCATRLAPGRAVSRVETATEPAGDLALATMEP